MLKKSVFFLITLAALCGCGYKGALYIPDAPSQNAPSKTLSENASDADSSSDTDMPALHSGEPN